MAEAGVIVPRDLVVATVLLAHRAGAPILTDNLEDPAALRAAFVFVMGWLAGEALGQMSDQCAAPGCERPAMTAESAGGLCAEHWLRSIRLEAEGPWPDA